MKGARNAGTWALLVGVLALAGGAAHATIAYQVPAGTTGNQTHSGPLGMEFDVLSPVTVHQLGVFDSGSNGLSRNLTATLYERSTQSPLVSLPFTGGSPGALVGGSRFKPLATPLVLPAGFQGCMVAENYGGGEPNGNSFGGAPSWTTDSGGGLIAFVGSSRWGSTAGTYPPNADGGPANRYAAGTFVFHRVLPKVQGGSVPVPNGSFELPGRADGGFGNDTTGWNPGGGTNVGDWNPPSGGGDFIQPLPDGQHVAFVNSGNLPSAPLAETLQAGTLYVLDVAWGHRMGRNPRHSMHLQAGGVTLGWVNNTSLGNGPLPAPGTFQTARGYFTANHNAPLGSALQIVLAHGGGGQANFDRVRLRKVAGASVPLVNPSFEVDNVPAGGGWQNGATGWVQGGAGGGVFEHAGQITPADGLQSAFVRGGGSLTQTLSETALEPNFRYLLLVEVADRESTTFGGYQVELLAGGTTVALDNNSLGVPQAPAGSPGYFYTTSVVEFFAPPGHPLLYQDLGIRLTALGSGPSVQTYFDNVRLFAVYVPEPGTLTLLALGGAAAAARRRRRRPGAA